METGSYLQALLALLFVLGLLGLLSLVLRRVGWLTPTQIKSVTGEKQYTVGTMVPLDMKHKLVQVDGPQQSYLIILGGQQPVVVDRLEKQSTMTVIDKEAAA